MNEIRKRQGAGRGPGGPTTDPGPSSVAAQNTSSTSSSSPPAAAPPTSSPSSTSTSSSSTPSTTPNQPTSTPPTSSPTSSSTPVVGNGNSSSSSSTASSSSLTANGASSTSSPTTASSTMSQSVSVVVETEVITDAAGQTTTVVSSSTSLLPVPSTNNDVRTSSTSHTGAIVGGVVGGVVGLVALVALAWYFFHRRRRFDFDGNFDPDHVVSTSQRGSVGGINGLLDSTPGSGSAGTGGLGTEGSEVTPYAYNPEFDAAPGQNGMRQFGDGAASFLTVPNTGAGLGLAGAAGLGGAAAGYAAGHSHGPGRVSNEYYDPNAPYPPLPYPGGQQGYGAMPGQAAYAYGASPYNNPNGGAGDVFRDPSPGHSLPPSPNSNQASPQAPSVSLTHSSNAGSQAAFLGAAGAGVGAGMSAKEREAYAARMARERSGLPPSAYGNASSNAGNASSNAGNASSNAGNASSNAGNTIPRPNSRGSSSAHSGPGVGGGGNGSGSAPSIYSQPQSQSSYNPNLQQYYNYSYPSTAGGVLRVANPEEPDRVVVHQDGGRAPMDEDVMESPEIPPTYDSIPTDERR